MNVRSTSSNNSSKDPDDVPLAGAHGELVSVSIIAEARDLEDLLDRLGQCQYPIDAQIFHDAEVDGRAVTLVEFPAYGDWLDEIHQLLAGREAVTIRKCVAHASTAAPN
jgi:hypothetical protein